MRRSAHLCEFSLLRTPGTRATASQDANGPRAELYQAALSKERDGVHPPPPALPRCSRSTSLPALSINSPVDFFCQRMASKVVFGYGSDLHFPEDSGASFL